MAVVEQVFCIVRDHYSLHSDCRCIARIKTHVNTYTRLEAYNKVTTHPDSLYVQAGSGRAFLIPAEREGVKYVKTKQDDTTADNLLQLPDC